MELLIRLNEYHTGTDAVVDEAVRVVPDLLEWAKQARNEYCTMPNATSQLRRIVSKFQELVKA